MCQYAKEARLYFFQIKGWRKLTGMILGPAMFRWRRVLLLQAPTFLVRGMAKRVKERVRCIPQARNTPEVEGLGSSTASSSSKLRERMAGEDRGLRKRRTESWRDMMQRSEVQAGK